MEGGCYCGKIRFVTTKKPSWIGTCYCTDCQKVGGGMSMTMANFKKEDYRVTLGKPKSYRSSPQVTRSFCEACGSPMSYEHAEHPDDIEIPIGIFDDLSSLAAQEHIWTSQKPAWVRICDELPQRDQD